MSNLCDVIYECPLSELLEFIDVNLQSIFTNILRQVKLGLC